MTVGEKCENSGLQIAIKVVYNQPIAVTPACSLTARPPQNPDFEQVMNKKEDCSER
jgi:hypothetical protein